MDITFFNVKMNTSFEAFFCCFSYSNMIFFLNFILFMEYILLENPSGNYITYHKLLCEYL